MEQQLGAVLMNKKVNELLHSWTKGSSDTPISKIEFRQHVKKLVPKFKGDMKEVDGLFDSLDADHGGTLDLSELKEAFRKFAEAAKRIKSDAEAMKAESERLRVRGELAKEAMEATKVVEETAEELRSLGSNRSLDDRLGRFLQEKNIKIGELVRADTAPSSFSFSSLPPLSRLYTFTPLITLTSPFPLIQVLMWEQGQSAAPPTLLHPSHHSPHPPLSSLPLPTGYVPQLGGGGKMADAAKAGPEKSASSKNLLAGTSPTTTVGCDKITFRENVRKMGLEDAKDEELDTLFDSLDRDGGGTLDMNEVRLAFKKLQEAAHASEKRKVQLQRSGGEQGKAAKAAQMELKRVQKEDEAAVAEEEERRRAEEAEAVEAAKRAAEEKKAAAKAAAEAKKAEKAAFAAKIAAKQKDAKKGGKGKGKSEEEAVVVDEEPIE